MFTGIVRETGRIETVAQQSGVTRLRLSAPLTAPSLALGDSLAVNGICLTVTAKRGPSVEVEATGETRRVTTLAKWRSGDQVHLEPALRAGDPLGGHIVLGHVDGVGRVVSMARDGAAARLRVAVAPRLALQLLPKGSIAVDGVSLTLDEGPFRDGFTVTLVPHTLAATRLGALRPGAGVNIEIDALAKSAAREAAARSAASAPGRLTLASLLERGWQRFPR